MIGGLWKSASTTALIAAAGLFVGGVAMPSAKAADLGGDCCADLEERVAELEATTARKGNRRMSLTVSGQVTRSILYWNDGSDSGTYAGLDNHNQSTRFVFSGSAKISPNVTAGFEFMTEWAAGARTSQVDQSTPDVFSTGTIANGADGVLAVRTANWWLEDKTLGRVTVGRLNVGGPVGTIALGGISTVAHFSPGLVGGGFLVTGPATGTRLGAIVGPTYGGDRIEGIRYDTANLGGFVGQATWGEDDVWSASLRYAGEFGGIRVAAGIGYQVQDPSATQLIQLDTGARNIDNEWSGSLALMHVASGLFAQGHYAESEFQNGADAKFWMVQAGITKNWFGLGNTSFYGEYGEAQDYIKAGVAGTFAGFPAAASDVTFFGLGVVQQIDAAAMELYLGWRRFESDVSGCANVTGCFNGTQDLDLVHGGARIRF
jgi:hypothetical protein